MLLAACAEDAPPVEGFIMPPGDAVRGQQVFIDYKCYSCHTIPGIELPQPGFEPPFVLTIGARLHRVKTTGELLTAVVYPDHVVSPKYVSALKMAGKEADLTTMPEFGGSMSVTELIDLVAFLDQQYTRLMPAYYKSHYPGIR
jgi:hypothetical protein